MTAVAPEVVDLFCGVGALSHGLKLAGCNIVAGYDTDERCKHAYETNNDAIFVASDVGALSATEIKKHYSGVAPTVLAGCAPCQPFSSYKHRYDEDPQWGLVEKFAQLAAEVQPDFITMENVPALKRYKDGRVFQNFKEILNEAGYPIRATIAKCELFGVPQKRRRLVVVAARGRKIGSLVPADNVGATVKNAISHLPAIKAGEAHPDDALHIASGLSQLNMRRMKAAKPGGTWRDWPDNLIADCHRKASGKTYPGVYARMTWGDPAPTMTTQCFGFGNGRFGHPEQDRAISLREAAILQSFPPNYDFLPKGEKPKMKEVGRWIGNAVPVELGRAIGISIIKNAEHSNA